MSEGIDRSGQQFGKYRLIRLLGHGGVASVYLGRQVFLNTVHAIKVWPIDSLTQEALDEARRTVNLNHPHIIRVSDFDVDESTRLPFLAMDYASGGNLRQKHPKGTILNPLIVCDYVRQVADALTHAHQKQIVHCDIKPENLLIDQQGRILLGDFGIATVDPSSVQSNQQLPRGVEGTIKYMAPEQFRGNPSPKSDQYALAVVAYEWLCGRVPFESPLKMIQQVGPERPPSLTERGISPEIEGVVFKALEKDPDKRFPNVKDFALALLNACNVLYDHVSGASYDTIALATSSSNQVVKPANGTITLATSSSNQVVAPANPVPVLPVQTPTRKPTRRTFFILGLGGGLMALGGVAWWVTATHWSALPSCMPSSPAIASNGVMTAGVLLWGADAGTNSSHTSGGAPYVFPNGNGDPIGFEVDIANAIAQLMGITQQFYQVSYASLDDSLQSRQIDIILNGWEITPDHLKDENFSDPYYRYSQQLVVHANDAHFSRYTMSSQITLTEFKQYTFGTGAGYKASDLLKAEGLNVLTFDDPVGALKSGKVDIIMIDMPIVVYYIQGIGLGAIPDNTLRPIGGPLFADSTSNYVIGFKKADPNADMLRKEINQALTALKQNGTLKRIYQDWGLWDEFQQDIGIVDCV